MYIVKRFPWRQRALSDNNEIDSFSEFWPFYVGEHRSPINRLLHYVGTSSALMIITYTAITLSNAYLLLLAPIIGYGNAWIGHFFVEGNKPASFKYPLWSFFGDLKMLGYAVSGRMDKEMIRLYGSVHPEADAPRLT